MSPKYQPYQSVKFSGIKWLGTIPEHWDTLPGHRLFGERKERMRLEDEQLTASQKYGVIPQKMFMQLEDQKVMQVYLNANILKHVEPNDFVISMRSFQGGLEFCGYSGCVSSAYVGIFALKHVEPSFFKYLFKSAPYIQSLQSTSNLVRDGQALRFQNFSLVRLPVIPKGEQTQIAKFLDYETARIDALIDKQQQLIALLGEKRQAVISHGVTKGLNPDTPMRDSGVEWLGDVPAHWDIGRLSCLVSTRKGVAFKVSHFLDSGIPVIKASDIKKFTLRAPSTYLPLESKNVFSKAILKAGELVLSTVGSNPDVPNSAVGQLGRVPDSLAGSLLNQNTVVFSPVKEKLCNEFLYFLIRSDGYRDHLDLHAHGTANQSSLNVSDMLRVKLPLPALPEQIKIATALEENEKKMTGLIAKAQDAINLVQERRTALISASVTGKIDVRNWKPPTINAEPKTDTEIT